MVLVKKLYEIIGTYIIKYQFKCYNYEEWRFIKYNTKFNEYYDIHILIFIIFTTCIHACIYIIFIYLQKNH